MDWFQIEGRVHQGCTLSPCLFNFYADYIMQILGWRKHKLESRLPGEISDMLMIPPYGRDPRGAKESLDKGERGE